MRDLDGLALALRRRGRRRLGRCDLRGRILVWIVARHGILELAHPRPERTTDLRQPLRAEEQQRNEEQQDDVGRARPAGHVLRE